MDHEQSGPGENRRSPKSAVGQAEGFEAIRNASAEEEAENERRRPSQYQRIGQGALGKSEGRRQIKTVEVVNGKGVNGVQLVIILAALSFCALHLQAADNTNEVNLAVGQTYSLDLDSNPTTGYGWKLASPTNGVFMLVTNTYEPGKNAASVVGSGGVEHWTFKAVGKGRAELVLEYVRPWKKKAVSRKAVTVVCE